MEEARQIDPTSSTHHSSTSKIAGYSSLCEILISNAFLREDELSRCIDLHKDNGVPLAILLVRLGLVSERDMAESLFKATNLPLCIDGEFPEVAVLADKISVRFLKDSHIVPLDESEEHIVIAMADALDSFALQAVQLACGKSVEIKIATITQIDNALGKLFGEGNSRLADIVDEIESDEETYAESIERLKDLAGEAPIIRLVSLMINRALDLRASDIHIEPFENQLKLRYRIDGVLQEAEAPPIKSTAAIISRIKIMAKMNIAEHRLPQDGRIQLRTQGKLIDLRVSTVPTLHGESLVLRILDKQHVSLDFDELGFSESIKVKFQAALKLSHGILLVTGPTGSGKTTTLYTALQELNTPDKKILTVEDPVEYQIEGINQIQVKPKIGLNFADALRSIVRQDPDIIMIGEMRDLETASIAVQSALTGHLVFSTLHTNDAGSSITRLLDMGVEDYLLTSTLNGILSQRLIRKLCLQCRRSYTPLTELVDELKLREMTESSVLELYEAVGCERCNDSGYHGRSVITEFMTLSEDIRRLILSHADGSQIQNSAVKSGMDSIQTDGIKKSLRGISTIEEVMRVTQQV